MLIVYDSAMGKTERFVMKTNLPSIKLTEDMVINEPFVLVTYTTKHGELPDKTEGFLKHPENIENMMGVASSGHRNWGIERFCKAGKIISRMYNKPLLLKFEMSGLSKDVESFLEGVRGIYGEFLRVKQSV